MVSAAKSKMLEAETGTNRRDTAEERQLELSELYSDTDATLDLIAELEVKFKTLRRRNESLKTDLRAARKQIAKLEKRLESRKKKAKQEVLQPKAPAAAQVVETPVEPPKPAAPKRRVLGRTLAQLRPPKRLPPTPE